MGQAQPISFLNHDAEPPAAREQLNQAILEATNELAPQGIFTTDRELRISSWNRWLEHSTHLKPEAVIGKPLVEVIPSLELRRLDHYYRDALKGESKLLSRSLHGYLLPIERPMLAPDLPHMQQSARISPLTLRGEIIGTITSIEDVTEREWQSMVLSRSRQRAELLAGTLARLLPSRDPEDMVHQILEQVGPALHLDCCIHHFLEPHSQRMRLHSAVGLSREQRDQFALLEIGQGLCGTVLLTRDQLVINQLHTRTDRESLPCREFGLRSFAGFPLLIGSRLLGSLAFGSRTREILSEEDVRFLYTIAQYAAVALDRTHQENRVRLSEERFRDMADTVPCIIFTALADGSRDYVNSRFCETTGIPVQSALGSGWMKAVLPEDLERVNAEWQRCTETGETYSIEYRMLTRTGEPRWFYARARPIFGPENRLSKWFGTVMDIHDVKVAHEELSRAQAELANRAASLEVMVDERTCELRETINQLESFSYTVAHDLRAPIRSLEGFSQALLEDYGASLPQEAKTMLNNMARAARRLDALTKDVLNYTRLTTQELHLAAVDPAEVIQDVIVMNPALQPPAIVAVVRPMTPVRANRTLLSQCFSNLLNNAVKFVKPGVSPHVVISSEEINDHAQAQESADQSPASGVLQSPRRVRLWVQDNGIGMDDETREKVFGIFERGRSVNRIPGTGIGLAILAKAVQRMGGTYGVESTPGEGSRFWMELIAA